MRRGAETVSARSPTIDRVSTIYPVCTQYLVADLSSIACRSLLCSYYIKHTLLKCHQDHTSLKETNYGDH